MRYALPCILFAAALVACAPAFAAEQPSFELALKNHAFSPRQLTIPADTQVKLTVRNLDATPAEFESDDFHAERVVPAGGEATLYIGPLKAGRYGFFDDFHHASRGILIVK
jgi:Cupredoxin-like domain